MLLVIAGALGEDPKSESAEKPAATETPTPTPEEPGAVRAAALAEADEALEDDDFPAVLAAVAVLDESEVVDRYRRRIARRILRHARRSLRSGSYARALTDARRSRAYQRTQAAHGVMASANRGLAVQRARKRARVRAARVARDQRTCSSSEKQMVRYGGGVPAGCTDYSVRLADRRAAREAERALEEAEAIPEADAPSSDGGGESGNWCGATRDGDGDGVWCEGR